MTYLFATYWLPLVLALLLGAVVGFYTFLRIESTHWWPATPNWLKASIVLFVIGLLAAFLRWLPGTSGLYLETALLLFAAYLIGCFLGNWLAGLTPRRAAPATEVTASVPGEDLGQYPGRPPAALSASGAAPSGTGFDDLKRISGIGERNEEKLHLVGVWYFHQIADWNDDNIEWVSAYLTLPNVIRNDEWVEQARLLARNLDTDYTRRVDWKWKQ